MPDEFDRASEVEGMFRDIALSQRKPVGPEPTGFCLNCDAELTGEHRWCDADCREDWLKRNPRQGGAA